MRLFTNLTTLVPRNAMPLISCIVALLLMELVFYDLVGSSYSFWEIPRQYETSDVNVASFEVLDDHVTTDSLKNLSDEILVFDKRLHDPVTRAVMRSRWLRPSAPQCHMKISVHLEESTSGGGMPSFFLQRENMDRQMLTSEQSSLSLSQFWSTYIVSIGPIATPFYLILESIKEDSDDNSSLVVGSTRLLNCSKGNNSTHQTF